MCVVVGSKNPVKVAAVAEVLAGYRDGAACAVEPHDVASGIAEQPMTLEETAAGARNRAAAALALASAQPALGFG